MYIIIIYAYTETEKYFFLSLAIFKCHNIGMENKFLTLNNDQLEVVLAPLGASIYLIRFNQEIMTLTPDGFNNFALPSAYYGKTIGPISNRVKDGVLKLEGQEYHFDINEGPNSLHSGKEGISNKEFNFKKEKNSIIFYLEDEKAFYEIIYSLKDNSLDLVLKALAKADYPIALTNHAYFCLGDEDINNLSLTIPSHKFVETESTSLLPIKLKDILPCLDFNEKKKIIKDINDDYLQNHRSLGYDHCFLLDKGFITLENDKYIMGIQTDFEALQIYSDNYADKVPMLSTLKDHHRGVAMEPQDSLLNRVVLKKGQTYMRHIVYSFRKK